MAAIERYRAVVEEHVEGPPTGRVLRSGRRRQRRGEPASRINMRIAAGDRDHIAAWVQATPAKDRTESLRAVLETYLTGH